jgi:glycosyltransferase 2 family protein
VRDRSGQNRSYREPAPRNRARSRTAPTWMRQWINSRAIQILAGLACAFFFLALAPYRAPLAAIGSTLAHAKLMWLGAALSAYAVNLALRAWRWQIILRPVADVPYPIVARALVVGYGLNTIMPLRLGELFRAEFFKKTYGLSRAVALTSIVVERLFDGLTVVACLAIGLCLAARPGQRATLLIDVAAVGAVLFGAVLVLALGFGRLRLSRLFARFPRLSEQVEAVHRGFGILRTWRTMQIALLTLVIYLPDALSLWCVVKAVGLGLGFADTLVLVGAASLSTLLPSGPAFLGTLQFAYVLAIEFAGGSGAVGIAAATLAQLCVLLPIAVIAIAIYVHGSGGVLYAALARSERPHLASGARPG